MNAHLQYQTCTPSSPCVGVRGRRGRSRTKFARTSAKSTHTLYHAHRSRAREASAKTSVQRCRSLRHQRDHFEGAISGKYGLKPGRSWVSFGSKSGLVSDRRRTVNLGGGGGTHHGQGITEGNEADGALGLASVGPARFRQDEACGIRVNNVDIFPSTARETFAGDLKERLAQVDEVNRVKLGDREKLVHGFNVESFTCQNNESCASRPRMCPTHRFRHQCQPTQTVLHP